MGRIYFLGKNLISLFLFFNKKRSFRDNSIIFIKVLIRINVCDLDVELDIYICAEANNNIEVTNIYSNKNFYKYYAVIPRGTNSIFLKDLFLLKNKNKLIKFFPKNRFLINYNIKFYLQFHRVFSSKNFI